jgi:ceramide glucosyltransferase
MRVIFGIIVGFGLTYYIGLVLATFLKLFIPRQRSLDPDGSTGSGGHEASSNDEFLPPISVLKPVSGVDGNLNENLLSFINQDYPEYEIIIGVQSSSDPAIQLVEGLKKQYPSKAIHLIVGSHTLGYNPKINNLYGMMPAANYDYMVISDSNVIADKDYLRANIDYFKNKEVGIVTNLIKGIGGESVGALFENLHLNSFVIGNVSFLDFLKRKVVVGKSIFFRKSQFDKLGGLWELRNYLAEDYLMGKLYKQGGYKVVIAPHLISTTNHAWTMKRFINRHTRWSQLRWNLNKLAYITELLSNFPLWSLVYMVASGFSYESFAITALCWAAKITGDSLMNSMLKTGLQFRHCLAAPFKDLLIGFLWIVPLVNRRTSWRGNQVKIARNTLLVPTN